MMTALPPTIGNTKQQRLVQPTLLGSFFGAGKRKIAEESVDQNGIRSCKCHFCGRWFSPVGLPNHLAMHERNGDDSNKTRANPGGLSASFLQLELPLKLSR
jgi:hypothetical protein